MPNYRYEYIEKWIDAGLLDKSKMAFWHAVVPSETGNGQVYDYSGKNRHLDPANDSVDSVKSAPIAVGNVLGQTPGIYFNGTNTPMATTNTPITFKHLFILARIGGTSFSDYNGLVSGKTNYPLLVGGGAGQTVFINNVYAPSGYKYFKNNVEFPETNQIAPFGSFAVIEIFFPNGITTDGIQYGRDRAFTTRRLNGWVIDSIALIDEQSESGKAKIIQYFRTKYNLSALPLSFPTKEFTGINATVFVDAPPAYKEITESHKYEDGSLYSVEIAAPSLAPRRWKITFPYVKEEKRFIFDDFYDAARLINKFDLYDKYGTVWEDVQIEDYSRAARDARTWKHAIEFDLVSYSNKMHERGAEIVIIPPTFPPAVPTNFTVTKNSESAVTLNWTASAKGTYPVLGYLIWRDGFLLDVGNVTTYPIGSLPAGTNNFKVIAYDVDNNFSPYSPVVSVTLAGAPQAPSASFTKSAASGAAPLAVNFTDTSANLPTSWLWNFGDGRPQSITKDTSHTFTTAGSYAVTLTATNAIGSNSVSQTVTVIAAAKTLGSIQLSNHGADLLAYDETTATQDDLIAMIGTIMNRLGASGATVTGLSGVSLANHGANVLTFDEQLANLDAINTAIATMLKLLGANNGTNAGVGSMTLSGHTSDSLTFDQTGAAFADLPIAVGTMLKLLGATLV